MQKLVMRMSTVKTATMVPKGREAKKTCVKTMVLKCVRKSTKRLTIQWNLITVRNEVAKVVFLQMCVCPRGEGWVGGIPACLAVGIPAYLAAGFRGECAIPACLATGLQGGGVCSGDCSGGALRGETPPKQTATVADGTHPTGMHSCFFDRFSRLYKLLYMKSFTVEGYRNSVGINGTRHQCSGRKGKVTN